MDLPRVDKGTWIHVTVFDDDRRRKKILAEENVYMDVTPYSSMIEIK